MLKSGKVSLGIRGTSVGGSILGATSAGKSVDQRDVGFVPHDLLGRRQVSQGTSGGGSPQKSVNRCVRGSAERQGHDSTLGKTSVDSLGYERYVGRWITILRDVCS